MEVDADPEMDPEQLELDYEVAILPALTPLTNRSRELSSRQKYENVVMSNFVASEVLGVKHQLLVVYILHNLCNRTVNTAIIFEFNKLQIYAGSF